MPPTRCQTSWCVATDHPCLISAYISFRDLFTRCATMTLRLTSLPTCAISKCTGARVQSRVWLPPCAPANSQGRPFNTTSSPCCGRCCISKLRIKVCPGAWWVARESSTLPLIAWAHARASWAGEREHLLAASARACTDAAGAGTAVCCRAA